MEPAVVDSKPTGHQQRIPVKSPTVAMKCL